MPKKSKKMGRPRKELAVSADELAVLEEWARRPTSPQRLVLRAKIVLLCARGMSNTKVAASLRTTHVTVGKWRERFRVERLEGLNDEYRPGSPRKVTDAAVEKVVAKTLETTPKGSTHWSRRTMASSSGLSADTVGRIWKAFGLKPHLRDSYKLSPDPLFIEKVRDIVGLYMSPPENAIVLCVDEKSQMQALDRTQPLLPMRPGQAERGTHDYVRHGTTSLFAALDVKTGRTVHKHYRRHRSVEFVKFLDEIDGAMPKDATEIHIVMDNYGTHKTPAVKRWLSRHPRYRTHFTPTYSSWINLVERLFAEVTDKAVRRGAHRSVRALEAAVDEYLAVRSENPQPFIWKADADSIIGKVEYQCQQVLSTSGHTKGFSRPGH